MTLITWEHEAEELEVKVEGRPGGRLVLADRGNNWNIVLGIGGVEEGVEPSRPRRDFWIHVREGTLLNGL